MLMRISEIVQPEQPALDAGNIASLQRAHEQGFVLPLFHKTDQTFDVFHPNSHFGSSAQAQMRAAGKGAKVLSVLVRGSRFKRVKDTGRNRWDAALCKRLERQGFDGIVYLNRYEGIPPEEFERLRQKGGDEDRLSDAQFKKLCPSAEDSYIVFDPRNIRSTEAAFDPANRYKAGLML